MQKADDQDVDMAQLQDALTRVGEAAASITSVLADAIDAVAYAAAVFYRTWWESLSAEAKTALCDFARERNEKAKRKELYRRRYERRMPK